MALAILCIAGLWRYMEYHRMQNPNRTHPPMEITASPRTFCIGRTLVDLPQGLYPDDPAIAPLIRSSAILDGVRIEARPNVALEEFNAIVANRWAEVQTYTHNANTNPYVKPSQRQQVRDNGWILAFNHEEIKSNVRYIGNGQNTFEIKIYYDAEGYFWDKGTMFTMADSGVQIVEEMTDLMQRSRFNKADEVPQETGICLNGGFIQIYYMSKTESYSWRLELPAFNLSFAEEGRAAEKSMLENEFKEISPTYSEKDDYSALTGTAHRAAKRPDDPLPGEEVILTSTTYNTDARPREYASEVAALWDYQGRPKPDPKPALGATLGFKHKSTHTPGTLGDYPMPTPGSSYPTKEEFFALWDAIIGSIRFYPGALTPAPEQTKPEPPPLPSARQIQQDQRALDDFLRNG